MSKQLAILLHTIQLIFNDIECLELMDLPSESDEAKFQTIVTDSPSTNQKTLPRKIIKRRFGEEFMQEYLKVLQKHGLSPESVPAKMKERYIKSKIQILINQTVSSITRKYKATRDRRPPMNTYMYYKTGYEVSKMRHSRSLAEEWFDLAMKHKDDWGTLHLMKAFEYIYMCKIDIQRLFSKLLPRYDALLILSNEYDCLKFMDLPSDTDDFIIIDNVTEEFQVGSMKELPSNNRRLMDEHYLRLVKKQVLPTDNQDNQDVNIKQKISTLIDQSIADTTNKVKSINSIKERNRQAAPYRAGFLLSMVMKCRMMLKDLFNLAMKHRYNWKSLQQMKVFEYIVHTNVDTTNLVRQLVETHMQYLNSTKSGKQRVVLL